MKEETNDSKTLFKIEPTEIQQEAIEQLDAKTYDLKHPAVLNAYDACSIVKQEPFGDASYILKTDLKPEEQNQVKGEAFANGATTSTALLEKGEQPINKCTHCVKTFKSLLNYHRHLRSSHGIIDPFNGEKPDINDPNNYCRLCDKTFSRRSTYKDHLMSAIHKITQQPLPSKVKLEPDTLPDPNDANNYCCVCNEMFSRKAKYRDHLSKKHKMKLNPLVMTKKRAANLTIQPDMDDPNFYCRSCDTTLSNKYIFRRHLENVHDMKRPPTKHISSKPTVPRTTTEDRKQDRRCDKCNILFAKRALYRQHLRETHKMKLKSLHPVGKPTPGVVPDFDDPNFFCRSCNFTYKTKPNYRDHLAIVHQMKSSNSRISTFTSDIIPEIDEPNNYCNVCKKTYSTKKKYRKHLRFVHLMKVGRSLEASRSPSVSEL